MSRKKFGNKECLLKNIIIDLMIADLLTKDLQPKTFKEHVQRMVLVVLMIDTFTMFYTLELKLCVSDIHS